MTSSPLALQIFSAEQVHAALPWHALVEHLASAFAQGAEVPVRHAHKLGGRDALLLMPAWSADAIGVKLVTVIPGNAVRNAATVQASYLLLERATGRMLALIDGEALTLRRTAAASVLAASYLARPDARRLLIVGTGHLAGWMARAYHALRPELSHIAVWGRNAQARTVLAQSLASEGLPAHPCDELRGAVQTADIVCCVTTSTVPLVLGEWLQPGTHLDLVGAFKPDMRETDDAAVVRSHVFVDTYSGALSEAGDLVQPLAAGQIDRAHVRGELAQLVRGEIPGRQSAQEITLFKSVGTALEDLAAARMVLAASH
ncbi:MAG: ornithine cyclodeaminase family protein [Betaproteobacteria bacterium]